MVEGLFGTDLESIISDWMEIFDEFGDNAEGAFDKIDASIDKMIYNMMRKILIYRPMMEALTDAIDDIDANGDGKLTQEELLNSGSILKGIKGQLRDIYNAGMSAIEEAELNVDDIVDGVDPTTLTGSIQNISEETGGVIAGRMNAVIINQAEAASVLRQSLICQIEIRNHTAQLAEDVRYIRSHMSNSALPGKLLHYGISEY